MAARIDHVSIPVGDIEAAASFYDPVLATLGLRRFKQRDGAIGYGPGALAVSLLMGWPLVPTIALFTLGLTRGADPVRSRPPRPEAPR